jgi:hypothetical protein
MAAHAPMTTRAAIHVPAKQASREQAVKRVGVLFFTRNKEMQKHF